MEGKHSFEADSVSHFAPIFAPITRENTKKQGPKPNRKIFEIITDFIY